MGFHSGVGVFMQRDPLLYADSMNLYQGLSGNPIRYRDPSGLMPNKDDVITLAALIGKIEQFEGQGKSPCDVLKALVESISRFDGIPKEEQFWKYVAVSDPNVAGNFIDLTHFFQGVLAGTKAPDWVRKLPKSVRDETVNAIGRKVEEEQKLRGQLYRDGKPGGNKGDGASYMGPEDLISNLLGANFGMDGCGCGPNAPKLSEQITKFFEELGVLGKEGWEKLPNYEMLPQNEDEWQDIWEKTPDRWERMKHDYFTPQRTATRPTTQPR